MKVRLTVNATEWWIDVEPRRTLADALRDELDLTGTHVGCEHGVCGACTVLLDGVSVRSCLVFAVQAQNRQIETIEGLADPEGNLNNLQRAFSENYAAQCGFCTSGMLMTVTELLRSTPSPTEEHVRETLAGVICRCTGYQQIVEAVLSAAHASDQLSALREVKRPSSEPISLG
jgi:carbon-monoxide dehydrogenase small subunit